MSLVIGFAAVVAVIFVPLGLAKALALAPMRALATEAGMSVRAYRAIGALEICGAIGVLLGLAMPLLGGLAGTGLLALLGGAVVTHVRKGHAPSKLVPALLCAGLVIGYLVTLFWAA
jgi:hypothetical protein